MPNLIAILVQKKIFMKKYAYLLLSIPVGFVGVRLYQHIKEEKEVREERANIQRLRTMAGLD